MSLSNTYLLEEVWAQLQVNDPDFYMEVDFKAVPKGRPRMGKNHVYTPKRTRNFENMIRAAGETVQRKAFTCPVRVEIRIWESIPKSYKGLKRTAAELGLAVPPVGDLDNKVKAITDALNGIAYMDDRQIMTIDANKRFSAHGDKITIIISRCGMSLGEIENVGRQ